MKIKYVIGVLVTLFLATVFTAKSVEQNTGSAEPREPRSSSEANSASPPFKFPDVCIPGVPEKGDCCLWEIQRRVDGKRVANYGNPYTCDMGPTRRGEMKITMKLKFPGTPCDQQDIPPDNSTLEAKGQVIRQNDQYAYFTGEFTIKSSAGKLLFEGRIETTDRLGSHNLFSNCERCRPSSHFEGWLVGRGTDAFPNHTLRALIVSRGTVPSPTLASTPMTGSLTGTLIKCPF
jgi:hypothetical protein